LFFAQIQSKGDGGAINNGQERPQSGRLDFDCGLGVELEVFDIFGFNQ
jgi:hypothetical protein